jgi:hypothetical protein
MIRRIAPVLALAVFAVPSFADDAATADKACASQVGCSEECAGKEGCTQQCAGKAIAKTECSGEGCPIEAAMSELPKLSYLVGTEETCCPDAAAKIAKEHNEAVKYVLAKKKFDTEAAAIVALTDATEKYVSKFVTPSKCEVSGKVTVAGKELCCEAMAGKRAELAKKAMEKVEMTYLVGNEECACPNKAAALAKETGKDKLFVVAGEKTCCNVDARLKLARAKYRAALVALAQADASAEGDDS